MRMPIVSASHRQSLRWRLRTRGRQLILGGGAALGLVLTGCGTSPAPVAQSVQQLTLVGGVGVQPTWWFPILSATANSVANAGPGLMYKPLVWIGRNGTINWARSIAQRIVVSAHDTVYTIYLNPRWHWSNGRPVTAADVAYAWTLNAASAQPNAPWINAAAGAPSFDAIRSVAAVGPFVVRMTVTQPFNPYWVELNVLGDGYLNPIPQFVWDRDPANMTQELKWIATVADQPTFPGYQIVDGPYKLGKVVPDAYWTLVANLRYDGHKPAARTLVYVDETAESGIWLGLRKGLFDDASIPPSDSGLRAELRGYTIRPNGYVYGFNLIQPNFSVHAPGIGGLFRHLYFRQAMQLGIDQLAIIRHFYGGAGVPGCTAAAPEPPNQFYDPHVCRAGYPFNPARGRRLLERHGWREVHGVMERAGRRLAFTMQFLAGSATDAAIAQLLKADWAQEGIDVTLQPETFDALVTLVTTPQDADRWTLVWWGGGWGQGAFPALRIYKCGSADDFGGYCSATLDRLIQRAYEPGTLAQTRARLFAYETFVAHQLPVLFMPDYVSSGGIYPAPYQAVRPWLHGTVRYFSPLFGAEPWRWTVGMT
jgi:peptide/nickel transport system substrate-binding protein